MKAAAIGAAIGMACAAAIFAAADGPAENPAESAPARTRRGQRDWDASRADAGEQESKRTEVWPRDFTPPTSVTREADVVYGTAGGRRLDLDVVMRKQRPEQPRPAIVFIHGGSWKGGDKLQFHRQAALLADRYDIFGACISYRLSGEATFPAALQDCKCAVRWVRSVAERYRIDPDRVAVCGGSAGGHLAAMMAVSNGARNYEGDAGQAGFSSDVNLAILFNGEFDMDDLVRKGSLIGAMQAFFGGTPGQMPEIYRECSPILRLHANCTPMLLLHGTADMCVSHEQSLAMARRLGELRVPAEVEIYEGQPHAWFNADPDMAITVDRVGAFLEKHFHVRKRSAGR